MDNEIIGGTYEMYKSFAHKYAELILGLLVIVAIIYFGGLLLPSKTSDRRAAFESEYGWSKPLLTLRDNLDDLIPGSLP